MTNNIINFLLDLIFPPECAGCMVEGAYLCSSCRQSLKIGTQLFCPACKRPNSTGQTCTACQGKTPLNGLLIASGYKQKLVAELIQRLKYQYIEVYAQVLALLIFGYLAMVGENNYSRLPTTDHVFVPVPLNKRRLKERGFNQSLIVLQELKKLRSIKIVPEFLIRIRYTLPQMELKAEERRENISDAFACPEPKMVKGKDLVVFDDVYTTGATMTECAKVLKQAGAKDVWGLAIAHGQ